jgi:CRISPR-associated protein Csd1
MILQRLYALAQRERLLDDVAFETQPVPFVVQISKEGQYRGIEQRRGEIVIPPKRKGGTEKRVPDKGMVLSVPRPHGNTANQGFARYFVDTLPRVLPVAVEEKDRKKAEASRATYWQQIGCAAEGTQDPAVRAVQVFGEALASDPVLAAKVRADVEAQKPGASDRVTFAWMPDGGTTLLDRMPIREWYTRTFQSMTSENQADGPVGVCQITGNVEPLPRSHAMKLSGVPGGLAMGISLISFDKAAFESYGLDGAANAAVGYAGADGYLRALKALLSNTLPSAAARGDKTNLRIGGTAYLYWTRDDDDLKFMTALDQPELDTVRNTLSAASAGKAVQVSAEPNQFYLLGLSGNAARAIVRDYLERPLLGVKECLQQWFKDLRIADPSKDYSGRPNDRFPLWQLALATAFDSDAVAPDAAARLLHAALTGGPVSESLLVACLRRLRSEGSEGFRASRMALIKLILKRREIPVSETLNPDERHPAYLCGRLLAVFEQIQYSALGDVNANVVDKFYGTFSAAPALVFARLVSNAQNHLRKIRGDKPAAFVSNDRRLGEVLILLGTAPPPTQFSLQDQGRFALGYYHEKAKRFEEIAERKAEKAAKAETK